MKPFLAPQTGDSAAARDLANTLAAQGDWLSSMSGSLRGLADGSMTTWESPAGQAFAGRCGVVTGVLERVARRYAVAAVAVGALADVLEDCQAEVRWAQQVTDAAWEGFLRYQEAMVVAQDSGDVGGAAYNRAAMVQEHERVQRAAARHAAARERYDAADRACARVLEQLAQDGLGDSRTYNALTGIGDFAEGVSTAAGLIPPGVPVVGQWAKVAGAVGSGVRFTTDVTVKVAYGDGAWRDIGTTAALNAVGRGGTVLKEGGRLTNATAISKATTRAARRDLRLSTLDRVVLASRAEVGKSLAKLPANVRVPRAGRTAGRVATAGVGRAEAPAVAAIVSRQRTWVDDLHAVTRTPGTSPRMFVAGSTAQVVGDRGEDVLAAGEAAVAAAQDGKPHPSVTLDQPPAGGAPRIPGASGGPR